MSASTPKTPTRLEDAPWPGSVTPTTPREGYPASFFESQRNDLHSVLYTPAATLNRDELEEHVHRLYERDAEYENPFIHVSGRDSITEQFAMLRLLPGELWSEVEEVFEAEDFRGCRSYTFFHTLHFTLFPFLVDRRSPMLSHSALSSYASTPYYRSPPSLSPLMHAQTRVFKNSEQNSTHIRRSSFSMTPTERLVARLYPSRMLASLTSAHIKIQTRVDFNERGKVVRHEDILGIKELLEGINFLRPLYHIQRRANGAATSLLSRILLGPRSDLVGNGNAPSSTSVESSTPQQDFFFGGALGLKMQPGDSATDSMSPRSRSSTSISRFHRHSTRLDGDSSGNEDDASRILKDYLPLPLPDVDSSA